MNTMSDLQYICPSCFEQRAMNEVLFRRNVIRNVPDQNQSRQYLCMNPGAAMKNYSYSVADWRQYPGDYRMLNQGVIIRLKDYTGEYLTTRLCPNCHYPLINTTDPIPYMVSWDKKGVEFQLLEKLLNHEAGEGIWTVEHQKADQFEQAIAYRDVVYGNGHRIRIPFGLQNADASFGRLTMKRYYENANMGVVWLDLDQEQESIATVEAYAASALASTFRLRRPTAYLVRCSEDIKDTKTLLACMGEHSLPLLGIIQVLSANDGYILPWNNACSKATAACAMQWMAAMSGGGAKAAEEGDTND